MKVTKFAAPLGASITDLDVRNVTDDHVSQLHGLFGEHQVLVFPRQELTVADQLQFARRWGPLQQHPYNTNIDHPEVIRLTNRGKQKNPNEHWHSDMSYEAKPPKLTMLYALEAPELGGDTAFANQELAYAQLTPALRGVLDGLAAVHSAEAWPGSTDKIREKHLEQPIRLCEPTMTRALAHSMCAGRSPNDSPVCGPKRVGAYSNSCSGTRPGLTSRPDTTGRRAT